MRLQTIYLQTRRIDKQAAFYAGRLRLPVLERSHNVLALQAGRTRLVFWTAPGLEFEGHYHFAFAIPAGQFEATRAWVDANGGPIVAADGRRHFYSENWRADQVYFFDPAENVVEFIAREDGPTSGGVFDGQQIEAVVEIGLTVPDVPAAARQIQASSGLPVYQNSIGDTFGALGDEQGLLILAQTGRIWFPDSGKPAVENPLSVSFEATPGQSFWLDAPPFPARMRPVQTEGGEAA
jgi:catechol-2,3-dioxygenase